MQRLPGEPAPASVATRRPRGAAAIALVALLTANLGLAVLHVALDLTLFQLIVVYWWEGVWIGLYSALKLLTASLLGSPYENRWVSVSRGAALLTSLVALFSVASVFSGLVGASGAVLLVIGERFADVGVDELQLIVAASCVFLVSHGISFVVNFLVLGEFRTARATALLSLPFLRCGAVAIALAIGLGTVVLVPGLAGATPFALIVIAAKLALDLRQHLNERHRFADDDEGGDESRDAAVTR